MKSSTPITPEAHTAAVLALRELGWNGLNILATLDRGAYQHRDGVSVQVRLPRASNPTRPKALIFAVEPRRGYRGRLGADAELRVELTEPAAVWLPRVKAWIEAEVPKSKAKAAADEASRAKHRLIVQKAHELENEVRHGLAALGHTGIVSGALRGDEGGAGVVVTVRVLGTTAPEVIQRALAVIQAARS